MMKMQIHVLGAFPLIFALLAGADAMAVPSVPVGEKVEASSQEPYFAKVGNVLISYDEFNAAFNSAARGKFYHGKPPEGEIAALQREVADQLVSRVLLLQEAKKRGIGPDVAEVGKTVQGYEQRYAGNERWQQNRDKFLPPLVARLEQENVLEQLEKSVRDVPRPAQKEVRAYYAANPEKFTEPEQLRVSLILLRVDPSSPTETWIKTDEEAKKLIQRLNAGEDFAALAREHSMDSSGKQGGDLGYLHKGMLPEGSEAVLAALKVGEISDSIRLLEGMAIFLVTDRKTAKLNSFERVEGRASDLLHRDQGDEAWKKLVAELKKKTSYQIDESGFLPLVVKPDNAQQSK